MLPSSSRSLVSRFGCLTVKHCLGGSKPGFALGFSRASTMASRVEISIPPADDFHHHFRDGEVLKDTVQHACRMFRRAVSRATVASRFTVHLRPAIYTRVPAASISAAPRTSTENRPPCPAPMCLPCSMFNQSLPDRHAKPEAPCHDDGRGARVSGGKTSHPKVYEVAACRYRFSSKDGYVWYACYSCTAVMPILDPPTLVYSNGKDYTASTRACMF